jgi:hypothetical protein
MAISDTPLDPKALQEIIKAVSPILSSPNFARDYLHGHFEHEAQDIHINEKTVFANPLAITVKMDSFGMRNEKHNSRTVSMLEDANRKLLRTVANETRCAGCSHFDVVVDKRENPTTMTMDFQLRTTCKLAKTNMTTLVCPDGSLTSKNTSGLDRSRVSFRPPPMVFMPEEDYKPADQPTTDTGDTAW